MPAGNSGSVTLNVQAQITGYEQSIKRMKQALEKVDPGTAMGKNLKKGLDAAEKQLRNLMKNATPDASSSAQIQKIVSDVNKLGESLADLGAKAQSITGKDLKLDTLGDGVKSVIEDLKNAKNELDTTIGSGVKEFISSSEDLKKAFTDVLGLDVDKLGPDEIFKKVSQAAKEATKDANKATEAVKAAQRAEAAARTKVNQLEERQNNIKQSESNLTDDKNRYLESYNTLYGQMMNAMKSKLGEGKEEIGKQILDNFFSGLTPKTAKDKVEEIVKAINDALDTKDFNKTQFKADFLGLSRGQDIYKNEMLSQMQSAKETMIENIKLNEELTPTQTVKAVQLINDDQIEKGVQDATKKLQEAEVKVEREVKKVQEELVDASKNLTAAQTVEKTALDRQNVIGDVEAQIQKARADLEAKNKELEERIKSLEQERDAALNETATTVKQEMGGAGRSAQALQISREEANRYEAALEKVKGAEQALGRLKGVVQQWFSVYAAIRMVTKAIKDIINTLTSLDKVITEIAIVTNMTQSELWGQMDSYAKMAQTYAASIEGVYQVSQLYYQQGLQTADVMALTEQTLKMARISGLGYAEATDYMTNAVRAFNMEMTDAQRVVDVYSAVAASSATNTTELAEAMSKTASSAHAVGSSFENTTAMMAVMIESTRESAQNIGSSLKSIISRYGEMKADPSKLVDSEGQEMSLNKVDKALQSVGISIHDAAGQFRDFDDVIMELAASWDSIDRNTQRYIATIMAGNRQQSRFLALVSGYDRLKELSEEAADSENASQLQFLKTLDSIQAKTQQIKTSFQELYVNSGLEKFYKNLLDYGNQLVQTFTKMPKTFNLPVLAISKFASQFYTLAKIVKTVFKAIVEIVVGAEREMFLKSKIARNTATEDEKRELEERLESHRRFQKEKARITQQGEAEETAATQQGNTAQENADKNSLRARLSSTLKKGYEKYGRATGTVLSTGAMIGSLYASSIDETKSLEDRQKKAAITGISSAVQGIGTGLMTGGWVGAIIGALSALPGIIEAFGLASESNAERIERLNNAIEETNNKALQSKDELKTLEDYKEKYDELYKVRNQDAESRQEWLDLNAEIVANYPELFGYLDEEGNYIADLTGNYEELVKIRRENYEQDLLEAERAKIAAAADSTTTAKKFGIDAEGTVFANNAWTDAPSYVTGSGLLNPKQAAGKMFGQMVSNIAVGKKGTIYESYLEMGEGILAALFEPTDKRSEIALDKDLSSKAISKIFDLIYKNVDISIEEIEKAFDGTEFEGLAVKENAINEIRKAYKSRDYISTFYDKTVESGIRNLITYQASYSELFEDVSAITLDSIVESAKQDFLAYSAQPENVDTQPDVLFQGWWNNIYMPSVAEQISSKKSELYAGIEEKYWDDVEELYNNLDKYTITERDEKLTQWGASPELQARFAQRYDDVFSERAKNLYSSIVKSYKNIGRNWDGLKIAETLRDNIIPEYWSVIQTQFVDAAELFEKFPDLANGQIDTLSNIWTIISQLSSEDQLKAGSIISNADFTSLTGIYDAINELNEAGFNDIATEVQKLTNYINVNLVSEANAAIDKVVSSMEEFDKALSNIAKGMSLKDATAMANQLNLSLSDFRFENGKYFYDDVEKIKEYYLRQNEELKSELTARANDNQEILNGYREAIDSGRHISFVDYKNEIDKSIQDYNTAIDEYTQYQVNSFLLSNGKIIAFYENLLGDKNVNISEIANIISTSFATGQDPSEALQEAGVYDDLQQYLPAIYKVIGNITSNTFKNIITSLNDNQIITGTAQSDAEKSFLQSLGATFADDGMEYIFSANIENIEQYKQALATAYKNNEISFKEYNAYLTQFLDIQAGEDLVKPIEEILKDNKNITSSTIQKLADGLGMTIDELPISAGELINTYQMTFEDILKIVNENIDKFTIEEYNNIIKTFEDASHNTAARNALKNITFFGNGRGSATMDVMSSIANALNTTIDALFQGIQYNELTGDYTFEISDALSQIENYEQLYTESIISYFNTIASLFGNAVKGTASAADKANLISMLENVGVQIPDIENQFRQTENGFKLADAAAAQVYQQLKAINELAAKTMLTNLVDSAKEADSSLSNIYTVMERIAAINKELNETTPGSLREQQLRTELDVATQIKNELEAAGNAFNFMDNSLPTGYTNPLSAWEGMAEAFKLLDSADYSKGLVSFQDFYNMVTAAGDEALRAAGVFNNDIQTSADLIQAAGSALKNVDGKTVVDLSKLGADFNVGANKMKKGLQKGIKTLAQNQIDMLDAMIQMLETVVAMEQLGDIDIDNDGFINFNELFGDDGEFVDGWTTTAQTILDKLTEAGLDVENIKIAGISLKELFTSSATELEALGISKDKFLNIVNSIYKLAQDQDWSTDDLTTVLTKIQEGLQTSFSSFNGQGLSFEITPEGDFFSINWADSDIEEQVERAGFNSVLEAKKAVQRYFNGNATPIDITRSLVLLGELEVDDKGQYTYTDSTGHTHTWTDATVAGKEIKEIKRKEELNLIGGLKDLSDYNDDSNVVDMPLGNTQVSFVETITESENAYTCTFNKNGRTYTGVGGSAEGARQMAFQAFLSEEDGAVAKQVAEQGYAVKEKTINLGNQDIKYYEEYTASGKTLRYKDTKGNWHDFENEEELKAFIEKEKADNAVSDVADENDSETTEVPGGTVVLNPTTVQINLSTTGENGASVVEPLDVIEATANKIVITPAEGATITLSDSEENTDLGDIGDTTATTSNTTVTSENITSAETNSTDLGDIGDTTASSTKTIVTSSATPILSGTEDGASITLADINAAANALGIEVKETETTQTTFDGNSVSFDITDATGNVTGKVTLTKTGENTDALTGVLLLDEVTGTTSSVILNADGVSITQLQDGEEVSFAGININGTDATITLTKDSVTFQTPEGGISIGDVDVNAVLADGGLFVSDGNGGYRLSNAFLQAIVGNPDSDARTIEIKVNNLTPEVESMITEIEDACASADPNIVITRKYVDENGDPLTPDSEPPSDKGKDLGGTISEVMTNVVTNVKEKIGTVLGTNTPLMNEVKDMPELIQTALNLVDEYSEAIEYYLENGNWDGFTGAIPTEEELSYLTQATQLLESYTDGVDFSNLTDYGIDTVTASLVEMTQESDESWESIHKLVEELKLLKLSGWSPTPEPEPTPEGGQEPQPTKKSEPRSKENKNTSTTPEAVDNVSTSVENLGEKAEAGAKTVTDASDDLNQALTSVPTDAAGRVNALTEAMLRIPTGIAGRINDLVNAINRIPTHKDIQAVLRFRLETVGGDAKVNPIFESLRLFKSGNVALAAGRQKTLMGELGPELVVSKGRYFVVGQNGAEMVDLDPDAVVFNHLQTKRLLKNGKAGRGKAVTNERNAVSMATGNTSGPAMASAKAALQALKQIRAMWQSLLGASLSDLGALGGSGGGGGGGGGGKDPSKNNAGFIADLERWYNLLRQIAKLEKDINYEQTLRNKLSSDMLANGDAYYASVKRELDALNQTTAKQAELASIQKDFYDKRAKELESSNFGKIFKYDENGQIQYNDDYKFANGDRGGLFALAELNRQNPDGSSALTVEEQYNKLKAWGFENDMLYDSQGQKIEYDKENPDDFYTKSVQAFWDKADGWKDELDGYYDSFREAEQASVEAQVQANKLLQEMQDKEIELQEKVYQAIIDSREKEIKDLQDTADAFGEAADKYIDGLNQQLQREQQMYQNNKNEQDLEKNRRRLAILQRSGASASEIASLQSTIDDQSKQMYFDKQQQQIDAIQEASDAQLEKMNEQIELMQMSLDYEKSNGLLWGQVYEVMSGTPSQIADFIKTNSAEYQGLSAEQYSKMSTDLDDLVGFVKAYEEDKKEGKSPVDNQGEEEWKAARAQLATMPGAENFTDEQWAAAKQAYTEAIASGKGADEAYKAAEKVLKGEPKISEDQEKQAKTAAENYFNNTKKTDALKAKYGKDLYATAEAAAKRAYQEKYAEILANGGTVAEAEKAAEEALLDVFVTEERKGTVRNAFKDEEAFKKAVKKKLGKGAKINDDVWADALDDIQDAFETSFMDNGDESAAYAAAAQEYKKQLRITKAEEYWEDWVSKIKKKKKPKSDQKKMKDVLSSNKPIGVEQVNKAHDAFVANFKGGDKKKKRKNARAAAKKILLDAYKSKSYSQGGIVDYTGIANVHGTRTKPEAFLNADEVKMWRNDILGNHSGSLTSSLLDLNELVHNMVTGNDVIRETNNNGVSIENAVVNMNTTIANDYDAKRAGELALQQMLKIAQKTGNQGLSRR